MIVLFTYCIFHACTCNDGIILEQYYATYAIKSTDSAVKS